MISFTINNFPYFFFLSATLLDELSSDQLIYRLLHNRVHGYEAAKNACLAIPGFNLVAVRFLSQMKILLEKSYMVPNPNNYDCAKFNWSNCTWFYVDMIKVSNNSEIIQGATPLTDTDLSSSVNISGNMNKPYFIYGNSYKFRDANDEWILRPLCQANVFGVYWW